VNTRGDRASVRPESTSRTNPCPQGARDVPHRVSRHAERPLERPPTAVFDLLVDVRRLPEWNAHVHHVIERADRPLAPGMEWVVQIRAMGTRWPSRARAVIVDRTALSFEHRSCTDDGNPSYALWSWKVTAAETGSTLTVAWTAHPLSFWRKLLLARVRRPVLAEEVKASLAGLDSYLQSTPGDRAASPAGSRGG
jgi:uncharacterized protein YndB with AHSA1/START domain